MNNEPTVFAFPHTFDKTGDQGEVITTVRYGMELRDYFATRAMAEMLTDVNQNHILGDALFLLEDPREYEPDLEMYAKAAYRMADAMMKAREKCS